MIGRLQFSRRFCALAFILLCIAFTFAVPPRSRTVKKFSRPAEPVEVIAGEVKAKSIVFGKPFAGTDRWVGGLTFTIKNNSTKPVDWVKVALSFPNSRHPGPHVVDYMTYGIGRSDIEKFRGGGPPLKPGETGEVSYSWAQYQSIRGILDGMDYPRSIMEIEVSVQQVSFAGEHETMWIEGQMCKEDYHSPTGWSPVKP